MRKQNLIGNNEKYKFIEKIVCIVKVSLEKQKNQFLQYFNEKFNSRFYNKL